VSTSPVSHHPSVAGYIAEFVAATIFTMGAFEALFGKLTRELGAAGGGAVSAAWIVLYSPGSR